MLATPRPLMLDASIYGSPVRDSVRASTMEMAKASSPGLALPFSHAVLPADTGRMDEHCSLSPSSSSEHSFGEEFRDSGYPAWCDDTDDGYGRSAGPLSSSATASSSSGSPRPQRFGEKEGRGRLAPLKLSAVAALMAAAESGSDRQRPHTSRPAATALEFVAALSTARSRGAQSARVGGKDHFLLNASIAKSDAADVLVTLRPEDLTCLTARQQPERRSNSDDEEEQAAVSLPFAARLTVRGIPKRGGWPERIPSSSTDDGSPGYWGGHWQAEPAAPQPSTARCVRADPRVCSRSRSALGQRQPSAADASSPLMERGNRRQRRGRHWEEALEVEALHPYARTRSIFDEKDLHVLLNEHSGDEADENDSLNSSLRPPPCTSRLRSNPEPGGAEGCLGLTASCDLQRFRTRCPIVDGVAAVARRIQL